MEFIDIERTDGVAVLIWNHEEQNRLTTPFLDEHCAALAELAADDSVAAVVITGAQQKFFSTGIHLEWLMGQGLTDVKNVVAFMEALNHALIDTTAFPKPLVAALNGHAIAGGAIMAACMDFRLMPPDRGFVRLPEVQINIPFWPGMTAIFQAILPPSSFRDMAYTGDRYTSAEAHEMGYVDELVEADKLRERAIELAAKLGGANSNTYAAIKLEMRKRVLEIMRSEDPAAASALVKNFS